MKKNILYIGLAILSLSACTGEYLNPGTASEQQVVNSQTGLIAMVNGLQYKFTTSRAGAIYASITADGLTTKQLKVLNAGNTDEVLLESGGTALTNSNSIITNLWNQSHLTKANADIIIANSNNAPDAGIKSGILAYAHTFRALSLGTLATYWEQAPIQVGKNASFSKREDVLKEAIKSLETAASTLQSTPPTAAFTSSVVGSINIGNTVQALLARYNLMLGNYDAAIAAANKVNESVKSGFNFDDVNPNPIFFSTFGNRNVTEPTADFGLSAALAPAITDGRRVFYYSTGGSTNLGKASFFTSNTATIPVYLAGEMTLIKAEAYARKNNLADATAEVNKILTKKSDAWGVAAAGEAYAGEQTQAALLDEIYRQRCIELFLSGMRIEDSRRFGRPASERNRNFYPYPLSERNNNTSTPSDPAL